MQALIFLNLRVFVNGIRRALSSWRRLLGLLFFVGYYVLIFARPGRSNRPRRNEFEGLTQGLPSLNLDVHQAVLAMMMAVFVGWGLFQIIALNANKNFFTRSDVDVLFSLPLERWKVLILKFIRDSLFTAIVPFLILIFFLNPARTAFKTSVQSLTDPAMTATVFRAMSVSWILSNLAWVAVAYAVSLYLNRPEERYDRIRKVFSYASLTLFLLTFAWVIRAMVSAPSWSTAIDLSSNPFARAFFFIPTIGAEVAVAPLRGSWGVFAGGCAALIAITVLGLYAACRQASWAYEIAAMTNTAHQEVAQLQKQGDYYGMVAAKLKTSGKKIKKDHFVMRWDARNEWALVWREAIMSSRLSGMFILLPLLVGAIFLVMLNYINPRGRESVDVMFFCVMLAQFCLMTGGMGQSGFLEMLRRGDLQKPLPFTAARVVLFEVLGKIIIPIFLLWILMIATAVTKPQLAIYALAGALAAPVEIIGLTCLFGMLTIMFPDVNDPTQRGFRGLVTTLAMFLFLISTIGVGVGAAALAGKNALIGILATIPTAALIAWLCSHIAGQLYENFNPSD